MYELGASTDRGFGPSSSLQAARRALVIATVEGSEPVLVQGIYEVLAKTSLHFGGLARATYFLRQHVEARIYIDGIDHPSLHEGFLHLLDLHLNPDYNANASWASQREDLTAKLKLSKAAFERWLWNPPEVQWCAELREMPEKKEPKGWVFENELGYEQDIDELGSDMAREMLWEKVNKGLE